MRLVRMRMTMMIYLRSGASGRWTRGGEGEVDEEDGGEEFWS